MIVLRGWAEERLTLLTDAPFCLIAGFFQDLQVPQGNGGLAAGGTEQPVFLPAGRFSVTLQAHLTQGVMMKNPLDSIPGTLVSGLILTVVLYVFLKNFILGGV